ncbi:amphiphysin isoform X1 [Etheostoma spectabile]|uniref:amphiphysin isoform X1 n=1 Tax=Etheostoma spectabile TaxID=54343 RepID=UPI0013AF4828|nr:amphiphysin isoform X1 [Etheostoma spectabile]
MAEIKTGIFAKNVQKRLNRAQEKVLQKLGKADETKDEQFEQVVVNFRRQESEGARLQREMKAYMAAIKGMQQASINLTQSLHEVYEPDWHGKDDVMVIGKDCDAMWEDFHNKLVDSTLLNLDEYLLQFPDLKTRVAKRSRKLIDYDSARHHMETLQVAGMKNDRKVMKAEEELKKAQKVFDELNVGLQDELPTLWDSRVGFYISTYKSITKLEAKFHREISLVCRQLYEVMTKLAEQHSDKMFTIQGAPSDSGPLRLARTPSPPDSESPPDSPDASSNHMLRPVSPGPPRPKSPIQLKKGPPVPPPPKATPTKEVAEEQIIDLFGGEFLPAPSPSQPNERPGQSLLDMDFDAFQPDESVSPIPQTAVPWDMWSANSQTAEPAADTGFVADWSADFGSLAANGDAAVVAEAPAVGPEGAEGGAQDWAQDGVQDGEQADGWQPAADTATPLQDREAATTSEDEVRGWYSETNSNIHPSAFRGNEDETGQANSEGDAAWQDDRRKSTPGLIFTNEYGEVIEHSTEDRADNWSRSPDGSGSEYETAEEWADGGQVGGWASADDELSYDDHSPGNVSDGLGCYDCGAADQSQSVEEVSSVGKESDRNCSAEEERPGKPTDLTSVYTDRSESRRESAFDSDPFADKQEGAFDSDPLTDTHVGGVFDKDPFAETQGGAFDKDPFAETQFGDKGGGFAFDPFAETSGEGAVGSGWVSDPFANSFPAASGTEGQASNTTSCQEVSHSSDFDSPFPQQNSASAAVSGTAEGIKDLNVTRIHKEPENSDMSEDEAANRRFGKLYPELDTEKEEVANAFNGFSQDVTATSFFADFDKMNEVNPESTEATETSETEAAEVQDKPAAPSAGEMIDEPTVPLAAEKLEEHTAPPAGEKVEEHATPPAGAMVDEPAAPPVGEKIDEPAAPPAGDKIDEPAAPPAGDKIDEPAAPPAGDKIDEPAAPPAGDKIDEPAAPPAGEKVEDHAAPPAGDKLDEPAAPPAGEKVEDHAAPPAGEKVEDHATPSVGEEDSAESSCSLKEKPDVMVGSSDSEKAERSETCPVDEDKTTPDEAALSEKMPIPSVVIEPASSNEGDDDRDADIISPTAISDNGVTAGNPVIKHMSPSGGVMGLPDDFLYKVETMHDFEAANSDELELKRSDVVLVVPTASVEDQEAGWLTGFKESEWLTLGTGAHKGLFPENFTQRLE